MKYRIVGWDQFSSEEYELSNYPEYDTFAEAKAAKAQRDKHVLETQTASLGFHDRTYIKLGNKVVV